MVPLVPRSTSPTIVTHRFMEQIDASPPVYQNLAAAAGGSGSAVEVSCVAFPLTDNYRPSHFLCGRNSGVLSLYSIAETEQPDVVSFAVSSQMKFGTGINDVCFSGDGLRIALSLDDGSIRLIDSLSFREVDALEATIEGPSTCVCFSPQSNLLVAGTYGGAIHSFDARPPRQLIRKLSPAHGCPVSSVSFHPDGTVFVSTGLDGLARVWDSIGSCLCTVIGSQDRGLGSGIFSPNGRYALLGALDDGALNLWDLAHSGRLKRVRKYPRMNSRYWMRAGFTDTGDVVGGSEDGHLMAWDASTATVLAEFDCKSSKGVTVPLACATSKSFVAYGGIGSANPYLLNLRTVISSGS